ncbi:MAG TPA: Ig-like domain-containing protein [Gemmatimonadales bacterium]|nr:Ig-like domain-containing protein [Gemmatimonadales bacterium]
MRGSTLNDRERADLRLIVALTLATGLGCASIAPPPGGPADRLPPRLVATIPDTMAVLADFDDEVEFQFDEVVAEGGNPNFGLGTGDLEKLIILSPDSQVPSVSWKRSRITVRPREGWRPNTVYRVELLPGVADLRGNRSVEGRSLTFSTGGPRPTTTLRGLVVDWSTQRPQRLALVEALLLPDSLAYRGLTDSAGRFVLGPLPRGEYLVYGALDQNNDRRVQPREAFDTARVTAGRDSVGELWAFRHDTLPARVTQAELHDTLSLALTFSQQLDPWQRLPPDSVRVRLLPDSTPVPVLGILPRGAFDTTFAPAGGVDTAKARADSIRARTDSIRADSMARAREAAALRIPGAERRPIRVPDTTGTGPLRTKPPLFDKLYVRLSRRLPPGSRFVVDVHGIKTVSGVTGTARGVGQIPAAPAPDTTNVKRDTVAISHQASAGAKTQRRKDAKWVSRSLLTAHRSP